MLVTDFKYSGLSKNDQVETSKLAYEVEDWFEQRWPILKRYVYIKMAVVNKYWQVEVSFLGVLDAIIGFVICFNRRIESSNSWMDVSGLCVYIRSDYVGIAIRSPTNIDVTRSLGCNTKEYDAYLKSNMKWEGYWVDNIAYASIVHEISHAYTGHLNWPKWLREGFSEYNTEEYNGRYDRCPFETFLWIVSEYDVEYAKTRPTVLCWVVKYCVESGEIDTYLTRGKLSKKCRQKLDDKFCEYLNKTVTMYSSL